MKTRSDIRSDERYDLERMMKRARWSMERPRGGCEYNILHRPSDKYPGACVYDIYVVDTTRKGRDPDAGQPVYLGTAPFREEAEEFVRDHKRGKAVFYFRGFRTGFHKHRLK